MDLIDLNSYFLLPVSLLAKSRLLLRDVIPLNEDFIKGELIKSMVFCFSKRVFK